MKRVIIGNGIVGLATAFGLLERSGSDDKIVIVGKFDRPGSATLAAAAMLNSFAEIEAGSLETELDLFRFEISHTATRMWPKFELELIEAAGDQIPKGCASCLGCEGGGCYGSGTYVINNTAADDLDDENFDAIVDALEMLNEQYDNVSPKDIPGYDPHQRYRATRAIKIYNEGWFNPRLMMEKLDAGLRNSSKVTFLDNNVDRLVSKNGVVSAAVFQNGEVLEADQFLLATGSSVTEILERSDFDLDIQRVFHGIGTSIEIKSVDNPLTNVIRTPNRGLACGLYAAPYFQSPDVPNDHILVGASNFIAPTMQEFGRLTSIEGLMSGVIRQINANYYRAELVRVNVGSRPIGQDTYPLLGKTDIDNLFIATGTKRDGFHLAPLISEKMSALMCGQEIEKAYEMFKPDRKLIRNLTRKQAIDKAARHQISASYQHGFEPATSRMPQQLEQQIRDSLERLHDEVGAIDWGIPPEMLDMYRYGHAKV